MPTIAASKVELSTELSYSFEWNKAETKSDTKTIHLPVKVTPGKAIMGQVTWRESSLTVPFRVKGIGTFASGVKVPISFNGMYEGIASWDVVVSWTDVNRGGEANARTMLAEGGRKSRRTSGPAAHLEFPSGLAKACSNLG
jgi:hypothetical protein